MPHELSLTVVPHKKPKYNMRFVNKLNVNKHYIASKHGSNCHFDIMDASVYEFECGYVSPAASLNLLQKQWCG
jgi:hypothetical protein